MKLVENTMKKPSNIRELNFLNLITFLRKERGSIKHYDTKIIFIFVYSKLNFFEVFFRNRIYHNEPICFNGNSIDFAYASQMKNELYELLEWIDCDLPAYVKTFDSIDNKITNYKR